MHIKSGYIEMQRQDISKVDNVIKAFINRKHLNFNEILKKNAGPESVVFIEDFSDIYYLDSNLKITSIIKKSEWSTIFRGYDFSASKPAAFFRIVRSPVPVNSGIFISPESELPGLYVASRVNNGLLVGRVDIDQLKETLRWFGEFSSNILLLATKDGYVLSKTSDKINLQILPNNDFAEITLNEKYMMSKGRSEAMDCDIAVFTPLSAVYSLIDSTMIYYPILVIMMFSVLLIKLLIAMKFFVKPVESFTSLLTGWSPGSGISPVRGFCIT
jgi:hypothetical protein